ncbi:MAG: 23S rRNA (adenine(1618)-N(6))-methyltransferase RlmF [Betaproteobacteria bacterium]|nr:23S rRNA (adenine(1618)-N(6))-methyltransferase RlmF [Betaproteobacteria bacterium]
MTAPEKSRAPAKPGLHPRNRHLTGYDFTRLTRAVPGLAPHLVSTLAGTPSIDFSKPAAVKALNRALLEADYGIRDWDIPANYLCPPIPGRADVLHLLADLLAEGNGGQIPRGDCVRALDIGVGANTVYPLIGHAEYGWYFLGVDTDPKALTNVRRIVAANPGLEHAIETRHQAVADNVFTGLLKAGEQFDLTLCNPPFHASAAEAAAASQRKWKNLGKAHKGNPTPRNNFGGQSNELWYPGGEWAFLERMIEQSLPIGKRCLWFTSLVSKADNLRYVEAALGKLHPCDVRIIPMHQGQKQSRLVAWTFQSKAERANWRKLRWSQANALPTSTPAARGNSQAPA